MSRFTPPANALSRGLGGTKAATPQDTSGLFHTLQGHVDDIRGLIQCGICIRPLYEPYTLACGHTFCYGCLTSWFAEGRSNKTCPDCRAAVKSQPAPAYLVRAVVQLFTSRAELLDKGETTDQHRAHQIEEAGKLEADKKNVDPNQGGLFRGIFNKARHQPSQPIIDLEDGVVRCPQCSWELDEMGCTNCGYRPDDDSMSDTDWRSDSDENSEMTDNPYEEVDDEVEDGFGGAPGFDWSEWYDGMSLEVIPTELRYMPPGSNGYGVMRGTFHDHSHHHSDFSSHDSVHDNDDEGEEDEDEDEEDEDMDSFIDDGEPSEDGASDSGRSTVVGQPEYSRTELHTIFEQSPVSVYSNPFDHNAYDSNGVPDSEDEEDSDTLDNNDADDDGDEDDEDDDEEEEEDDDDDDEPIRPAVASNRRRVPTYHILSSSSPLRVNGATAINSANFRARPRAPPPAGSSATRAIPLDDDSDEGPVGPTRRARDRSNFRPSAL